MIFCLWYIGLIRKGDEKMNGLLEELYKAKQENYYRMCLIKSMADKTDIGQNQLELLECLVKDAQDEYLEVSDRYHTALYDGTEKERRAE